MNYIFGYGSLICADSRSRTGISGDAHPIEIKGVERRWSVHSPDWPATALGAHRKADASTNGVYFPVDEKNLQRFDQREQGYERIPIRWQDVTCQTNKDLPSSGTLWVYIGHKDEAPSNDKPIMQSYLDVILNGCLNYGAKFSHQFIETTKLWQNLVDDRNQPRYLRPLKSNDKHAVIDTILEQRLPELFSKREQLPYK